MGCSSGKTVGKNACQTPQGSNSLPERRECPGDLQAQLHRSPGHSTVLLSVIEIIIPEPSLGSIPRLATYCPFNLSSAVTLQKEVSLGMLTLIQLKNKVKQWHGASACIQDTPRLKAEGEE